MGSLVMNNCESGYDEIPGKDDLLKGLACQPLFLLPNRVWRTYSGGKMIEKWQGAPDSSVGGEPFTKGDDRFPEDWVGSVVRATNIGREYVTDEGLSKVRLEDGSVVTLQQVICSNPAAYLGQAHVEMFGVTTALLVKVLDAAERLTIQVHPDQEFAKIHFDSPFGKTEAWYVLGARDGTEEPPSVLLGFKPGVTREMWRTLFEKQDVQGMINALHRIPVEEGQVFLIEAGAPHAIGEGCFLIEIQEPTDYTFRVEKMTPRGEVIPDRACHQGLGFDSIFESFHYDTYCYEEVCERFLLKPREKATDRVVTRGASSSIPDQDKVENCTHEDGKNASHDWMQGDTGDKRRVDGDNNKIFNGQLVTLIDEHDTRRFGMERLTVHKSVTVQRASEFELAIIVKGTGAIMWDTESAAIAQGQSIFLPAYLPKLTWTCDSSEPMTVLLCHPPKSII